MLDILFKNMKGSNNKAGNRTLIVNENFNIILSKQL